MSLIEIAARSTCKSVCESVNLRKLPCFGDIRTWVKSEVKWSITTWNSAIKNMIKMPVCDKCIKCDEELPKSGMFAVCSENGCLLHVGECSGVSKPSWKSMSTAAKR